MWLRNQLKDFLQPNDFRCFLQESFARLLTPHVGTPEVWACFLVTGPSIYGRIFKHIAGFVLTGAPCGSHELPLLVTDKSPQINSYDGQDGHKGDSYSGLSLLSHRRLFRCHIVFYVINPFVIIFESLFMTGTNLA